MDFNRIQVIESTSIPHITSFYKISRRRQQFDTRKNLINPWYTDMCAIFYL